MREVLFAARTRRIALSAALGGALLAPAAPKASDTAPAAQMVPAAPVAALAAAPPVAGKPVRLDASGSRGAIDRYLWDLDGNGSFETDGGTRAIRMVRLSPGAHHLAVRVVDSTGATADATLDLTVPAGEPPQPAAPPADGGPRPGGSPPRGEGPAKRPSRHVRTRSPRRAAQVRVAAASGVTIKNFTFTPGTITVNAGDTVTWTNNDSTAHTATATNGSFNTGTLGPGKSGSHTFGSAGSFAYICAIHPNMKGTVVVRAASSGSSGSSGSGGGSSGSSSGTGSASTGTAGSGSSTGTSGAAASGTTSSSGLPQTGLELVWVLIIGAVMVILGAVGHRRLKDSP